jgi:hemerythrin-like domain-containing protein
LEDEDMLQITPQMRILVAVEPADFRKGIDGIAKLCRNELKPGDRCPKCPKGRLYLQAPSVIVVLRGQAPIRAEKYEQERLRCNACGLVFTAKLPNDVNANKYDETTAAMIALMNFGYGMPFYRLERLQGHLKTPLPDSTQWDILKRYSDPLMNLYEQLIIHAAQGRILHNDDTNSRILDLIKENKGTDPPKRKGMFTSAIVSVKGQFKIILFFTGRKYAGENLKRVLDKRKPGQPAPLLMCDGLVSRNLPKDLPEYLRIVLALCLVHFRRKYVDLTDIFPDECMHVIDEIAKIHKVEKEIKAQGFDDEYRLTVHQEKSKPVMDALEKWLDEKMKNKEVEPNSPLGQLIDSMLGNWTHLTRFLHIAGAPIDNNFCEQMLKRAICRRKNSMFFKSEKSAEIADRFMSLISTAEVAKVNPFEYLVSVMKNAEQARQHPERWMPWNFHEQCIQVAC